MRAGTTRTAIARNDGRLHGRRCHAGRLLRARIVVPRANSDRLCASVQGLPLLHGKGTRHAQHKTIESAPRSDRCTPHQRSDLHLRRSASALGSGAAGRPRPSSGSALVGSVVQSLASSPAIRTSPLPRSHRRLRNHLPGFHRVAGCQHLVDHDGLPKSRQRHSWRDADR